jgi:hypothetical protein
VTSELLSDVVATTARTATNAATGQTVGLAIASLVLVLVAALPLLLFGNALGELVPVLLASMSIFISLIVFISSATKNAHDDNLRCGLPLLMSSAVTVLSALFFLYCYIESAGLAVVYFVAGASGGAFLMYLIRDILLEFAPQLADDEKFTLYWLGLVVVAILLGTASAWWRTSATLVITTFVGGYGVALAATGLIPAIGGELLPPYAFFAIFVPLVLLGAIFQRCREHGHKAARLGSARASGADADGDEDGDESGVGSALCSGKRFVTVKKWGKRVRLASKDEILPPTQENIQQLQAAKS